MPSYEPHASGPDAQAVDAEDTPRGRIVDPAFGNYVVTAPESGATAMKAKSVPPGLGCPATDAERALIRAELLSGLPIPDVSEPADLAVWRAGHHAELAAGQEAVYQAAADLEHAARVELEADLEP